MRCQTQSLSVSVRSACCFTWPLLSAPDNVCSTRVHVPACLQFSQPQFLGILPMPPAIGMDTVCCACVLSGAPTCAHINAALQVYYFSRGKVKPANRNFSTVRNDYTINLDNGCALPDP